MTVTSLEVAPRDVRSFTSISRWLAYTWREMPTSNHIDPFDCYYLKKLLQTVAFNQIKQCFQLFHVGKLQAPTLGLAHSHSTVHYIFYFAEIHVQIIYHQNPAEAQKHWEDKAKEALCRVPHTWQIFSSLCSHRQLFVVVRLLLDCFSSPDVLLWFT